MSNELHEVANVATAVEHERSLKECACSENVDHAAIADNIERLPASLWELPHDTIDSEDAVHVAENECEDIEKFELDEATRLPTVPPFPD